MNLSLIKETGIYFMPVAARAVVIPLTLFFYTKTLGPSDYGILGLIKATAALLLIFSNWGLVNGMIRFLGEKDEDRARLIGTAYYGSLLAGLFVFSLFFVFSPLLSRIILGSGEYRDLLIIGVATAIFGTAFQCLQNLMRMEKRPAVYVAFEIGNIAGTFLLGLYLVCVLKIGLLGVVLAVFLIQLTLAVVQYTYFKSKLVFSFSWRHFKKLILYGAPFMIIIISTWLFDSSDRYILRLFMPMSSIGIYNVAYTYGLFTQFFVTPFVLALLPYLFEFHRKGNYAQKAGRMSLYYISFYFGLVLLVSALARPYFLIFTPKEFHQAAYVAPLIALSYAWRGLFNIFCFRNIMTGNAKAQFFIELSAALFNIALNFALIPFLGLYGAALATLAAWIWMLVFAFRHNQKIIPILFPGREVIYVVAVGLLFFCLILLLNRYSWPVSLLLPLLYIFFIHRRVYSLTPLFELVRPNFFNRWR